MIIAYVGYHLGGSCFMKSFGIADIRYKGVCAEANGERYDK